MTDAYPLNWPEGWPRNQNPTYSKFKSSLVESRDGLIRQLDLLGASDIVISSNALLNKDGSIAYRQPRLSDTGVAAYFTLHVRQQCIPCDKWVLLEDNLHAIELTVEALRGLDRWGAKEMVDAAFSGFKALPEGSSASVQSGWWNVLGIPMSATRDEVEAAYRLLVKKHHPDAGGDPNLFKRLTGAYRQALGATR